MRARIYYVDLPNLKSKSDDDAYVNIEEFDTRDAAYKCLEKWGIEGIIADFFITEGGNY